MERCFPNFNSLYILLKRPTIMGEEGTFYKGVFLMVFAFGVGFGVGYKAKEWRMEWLKRRRERLAVKLQETQREIGLMKTS